MCFKSHSLQSLVLDDEVISSRFNVKFKGHSVMKIHLHLNEKEKLKVVHLKKDFLRTKRRRSKEKYTKFTKN